MVRVHADRWHSVLPPACTPSIRAAAMRAAIYADDADRECFLALLTQVVQ